MCPWQKDTENIPRDGLKITLSKAACILIGTTLKKTENSNS